MVATLDLSLVPPIYILPTHLSTEDLHEYEDQVYAAHGLLTYNASEARIFVGRVSQKKRALFELRAQGVYVDLTDQPAVLQDDSNGPRGRKRKLGEDEPVSSGDEASSAASATWPDLTSHILVVKLEWIDACLKRGSVLPYQRQYGTCHLHQASPTTSTQAGPSSHPPAPRPFGSEHIRTFPHHSKRPPRLEHGQTTHDGSSDSRSSSPRKKLPPPPDWVHLPNSTFACCRNTPLKTANAAFIAQLESIKLSRILTRDEIGVRAYSTSIASLSAYPSSLVSETEILHLPGCNSRIAELWREWRDSASSDSERYLEVVRRFESDPEMQTLKLFYNIWGVGADTARKLYYTFGLRDLDDIVEYHWTQLTRSQQIGLKFYSEFESKIPRAEVESIASTILHHARLCKSIPEEHWTPNADGSGHANDMVCVIVGGYRRGKAESGDVDVILSHRDEHVTQDLVVDVVQSLETAGWITHTLTLQTTTSDRDQQTLPYRGEGHGHGFDSLDKALCVWQDPEFDDQEGTITKNPNVHRRVDIILSPWRTVGCAVLGWSGGTTFQRDLRRFAKKERGWKFDSSGVRDRGTGGVVDLESGKPEGGEAEVAEGETWMEREKRVMEGLGIGFREAWERCTG
ncbi:DNA polymerase type-X family protein pol4 [Cyphellophora attinorum]|uniref:DNA polymerase n=1 Tax=Cyphellophora attinorum TaxID=1664694 RepID=A0A0N1HA05_9EURO|nr:DNA polymerase type-X family protein pol4 [Phialophora attinorum]KPI39217.1 DNA polymerase type-X family protein pol4 [Phialophora attinorum]